MTQFDRLTERARRVLELAQEEAHRLNTGHIGTEHLLIGLVREDDGVAGRVLNSLGVTLPRVRSAVEFITGRGDSSSEGTLELTPRVKKVLEFAVLEGLRLKHHYVGTEHLLLGLIREGHGVGAGVLESSGLRLEVVREAVEKVVEFPRKQDAETRPAEMPIGFERFNERARIVLRLAREESARFNHDYIGTEHLLLGLVREGDSVAARLLNNMGVKLPTVRSATEFIIGRGEGAVVGAVGLTPRSKQVLKLAVSESERLEHDYVGPEHLLLGMVREGEGIAAGILESLGVNLDKVRTHTQAVLDGKDLPQFPAYRPSALGPRVEELSLRTLSLLLRAHDEAGWLEHVNVGTGHLLLALIGEVNSPSATALDELKPRIDEIRKTIIEILGKSDQIEPARRTLSTRATFVLNRARFEARKRRADLVTPEHVLLAITDAAEAVAEQLFETLGIDVAEISRRIEQAITALPDGKAGPQSSK